MIRRHIHLWEGRYLRAHRLNARRRPVSVAASSSATGRAARAPVQRQIVCRERQQLSDAYSFEHCIRCARDTRTCSAFILSILVKAAPDSPPRCLTVRDSSKEHDMCYYPIKNRGSDVASAIQSNRSWFWRGDTITTKSRLTALYLDEGSTTSRREVEHRNMPFLRSVAAIIQTIGGF